MYSMSHGKVHVQNDKSAEIMTRIIIIGNLFVLAGDTINRNKINGPEWFVTKIMDQ